ATRIGIALVANEATFPDQPVPGADLIDLAVTLRDALSDVESARTSLREHLAQERALETAVDAALGQTARYVQNVSAGDETIIALAGMDVARRRSPVGALGSPEGLSAREGLFAGEIVLRWKRIVG